LAHVLLLGAAVTAEYFPAGHRAHTTPASGPDAIENLPGAQEEHTPSVSAFETVENLPGAHMAHACAVDGKASSVHKFSRWAVRARLMLGRFSKLSWRAGQDAGAEGG